VDRNLDVTGLAGQLRFVRPGAVSFTTVPLANTNYMAPNGESAVLWNTTAARALFERVKADRAGLRKRKHKHRHAAGGGQGSVWQAKPKTAAQAACR
jgi:hypothetical protein